MFFELRRELKQFLECRKLLEILSLPSAANLPICGGE